MKKFELTAENKINRFGRTLFRIKACINFTTTYGFTIKEGDLGGYIEKEANLSHDGKAWVCGNAKVWGEAIVCGDAIVWGDAKVWGDAEVCGDAIVWGDAKVCGNAEVCGDASISSRDHIFCVTPIGANSNPLTLFRTKKREISVSFRGDFLSIKGFISLTKEWTDKQKKVALAAVELAEQHIDLS